MRPLASWTADDLEAGRILTGYEGEELEEWVATYLRKAPTHQVKFGGKKFGAKLSYLMGATSVAVKQAAEYEHVTPYIMGSMEEQGPA